VLGRRPDVQVFKHRKVDVHGRDEPLQILSRHHKADAAHAITMLERKHDSLFIVRGEVVVFVTVINDEWKWRRVCQHIYDGCATCTKEAETQLQG
jgi:hypothetical protein